MSDFKRICLGMLVTAALSLGFAGCSSDSGGSTSTPPPTDTPPSNRLVDPYISGAVLYQDTDDDATWDVGEPQSTATGKDGGFSFEKGSLKPGGKIRMMAEKMGMHEGIPYELELSGVVKDDGTVGVISPLTTLMALDDSLTAEKVKDFLNKAAHDSTHDALKADKWKIEAADITKDPLGNGLIDKTADQITDNNELKILQASLATYGLLRVVETMKEAAETETSGASVEKADVADIIGGDSSSDVLAITTKFLEIVTDHMTKDALETINEDKLIELLHKQAEIPEPKMGLIVQVAVRVMDILAEEAVTAAGKASGAVEALKAAATRIDDIDGKIGDSVNKMLLTMHGFNNREKLEELLLSGKYTSLLDSADSNLKSIIDLLKTKDAKAFMFAVDGGGVKIEAYIPTAHTAGE